MAEHLAFPIRVTGGGWLSTVDQDSQPDIVQSVALLLDTRPGERRSEPEYGLPDPVFGDIDAAQVEAVITQWEERADQSLLEQVAQGVIDNVRVYPATSGPGDYEITTDDTTATSTEA